MQLGLQPVRIGAVQLERCESEHLLDLTGATRKEEWDLPLVAGARFLVTGNTGLAQLSTLLRKPHLYVNYLPLRLDHVTSFSMNSLLAPKRLRDKRTGRILTLGETILVCSQWTIHHDGEFFSDAGLEIINNSPEVIAASVLEMNSRTQGTWSHQSSVEALHSRAVDLFGRNETALHVFGNLRVRFSSAYLLEFPDLIAA